MQDPEFRPQYCQKEVYRYNRAQYELLKEHNRESPTATLEGIGGKSIGCFPREGAPELGLNIR
jgi:hypothetical protein